MSEAELISRKIDQALPHVKRGTLRFWGVWFGRPYDNVHTVLNCDVTQDALKLYFNHGEVLSIERPEGFVMDESTFKISSAEHVRWEWLSYSRRKNEKILYFEDFVKSGGTVIASTNIDWYTPDLRTDPSLPAVEILSLRIDVPKFADR